MVISTSRGPVMTENSMLIYLIVATFGAVLIYGIIQILKVRNAKRTNKHSAMGDGTRRDIPQPDTVGPGAAHRDLRPAGAEARADSARR
jgi:hypothetical protein